MITARNLVTAGRAFLNVRKRRHILKLATEDPLRLWAYTKRSFSSGWLEFFFDSTSQYQAFEREIRESRLVDDLCRKLHAEFAALTGKTPRGNPFTPGVPKTSEVLTIYSLIRRLRPKIVVETGVCNGLSTAAILTALEANGEGNLFSIDFPEFAGQENGDFWPGKGGAVIPADQEPGWLVPRHLRKRWELRIGKSQGVLLPLLAELRQIDFFLHDSEHSFSNQLFEFRSAFGYLKPGGVLAASDVHWSEAFDTFREEAVSSVECFFVDYSLALLVRSPQVVTRV